MDAPFEYVFPAIRGVQAQREYYVSMCPLRLIPKLFLFDEEELSPELRAQRVLNKGRLPALTRYMVENPETYTFSALTASIDGEARFDPLQEDVRETQHMGLLHVPMEARFIINDGQHRRAAIERALTERPELGFESIAVVFFIDIGLERSQQMFADLNRHAVRPSKSLGVLYDHRDDEAKIARLLVLKSPLFRDVVEMEKNTLSRRSRKLFTLSSIYSATSTLLDGLDVADDVEEAAALAREFWEAVAEHMPEWRMVRQREMSAGEVRRDFIHTHSISLKAIGGAGNVLLQDADADWKPRLEGLETIDWSRSNADLWEGRALTAGRVSKSRQNVTLTTNAVKKALEIPLTEREKKVENAFREAAHELV